MNHYQILVSLLFFCTTTIYAEKFTPASPIVNYFERIFQQPELLFPQSQSEYSRPFLTEHRYPEALVSAEEIIKTVTKVQQFYSAETAKQIQQDTQAALSSAQQQPATIRTRSCSGHIKKIMLPQGSELIIFGDLHGSIHALARAFRQLIKTKYLDEELRITKQNVYFIFLGDLVDYGYNGVDTLYSVMLLQSKNQNNVFICRGNHEDRSLNERVDGAGKGFFGFAEEVQSRYPSDQAAALLSRIYTFYEFLPYAIFIGIEGNEAAGFAQCCHGGIEPNAEPTIQELLHTKELSVAYLPRYAFDCLGCTGLNWSDFSGLDFSPGVQPSNRGCGYLCSFGYTQEYMKKLNIKLFLRGHQDRNNSFKSLFRGVHEPTYFFSTNPALKSHLQPYSAWIHTTVGSPKELYATGFQLKQLQTLQAPYAIAPVFTFSNASAPRANDDEGYGIITLGENWDDCTIQAFVRTDRLMRHRHVLQAKPQVMRSGMMTPELRTISQEIMFDENYEPNKTMLIIRILYGLPFWSHEQDNGHYFTLPHLSDDYLSALQAYMGQDCPAIKSVQDYIDAQFQQRKITTLHTEDEKN